ncbi:MAG: hypothetical protein NTX22_16645 [Ignavibacteriales bacterium]|nr:hypothetical protein [Ignavibacteriales bacterium]
MKNISQNKSKRWKAMNQRIQDYKELEKKLKPFFPPMMSITPSKKTTWSKACEE